MKKIPAAFLIVLMLAGWCRAGDEPLAAQTDGSRLWVAVTVPFSTATTVPTAETRLFVRPPGVGQKWQMAGTIAGEIRSLSSPPATGSAGNDQDAQLTAALQDGSWVTVWDGGSASGGPLPADGKMMAVTDADDGTRWAVGMVTGGITAARAAASPTTEPSTRASLGSLFRAVIDTPVLFQQTGGRWVPKAEVPDNFLRRWLPEPAAIWAGKDRAVVMLCDAGNTPRAWSWEPKSGWRTLYSGDANQSAPPAFGLLGASDPQMWVASGPAGIELFTDLKHLDRKISLTWTAGAKSNFHPALVFSGGLYRVFTVNDARSITEHDFKPDGQHVGDSTPELPLGESDLSAPTWIEAVLMGILTFTTVVVGYRQVTRMRNPEALVAPPVPAPFGRRFVAGLFDLSPMLLVVIIVSGLHSFVSWSAGDWIAVGAGFVFYWIWVSVFEVLNGRSLGKLLLGLRVVTIDGARVSTPQLLIRNLLRPVDPLLLILVSPLGQRTADFVADTMVVAEEEPAAAVSGPGTAEQKQPPVKPQSVTPPPAELFKPSEDGVKSAAEPLKPPAAGSASSEEPAEKSGPQATPPAGAGPGSGGEPGNGPGENRPPESSGKPPSDRAGG